MTGQVQTAAALAPPPKRVPGRPAASVQRPMVTLRMDPDVLDKLRASGKGWQTRVNAVLREAVEQGRI